MKNRGKKTNNFIGFMFRIKKNVIFQKQFLYSFFLDIISKLFFIVFVSFFCFWCLWGRKLMVCDALPWISCGKQNQYYGSPSGKSSLPIHHTEVKTTVSNSSDYFCFFSILDLSSRCAPVSLFLDQHHPESDSNLTADGDCRPVVVIRYLVLYRISFIGLPL